MMDNGNWNIPLNFYGQHFDLTVKVNRYMDSGRVALQLMHIEDGWEECFTTLTVNDSRIGLEDEDRQVIINHNVTKETLDAVINSGFLEPEPDFTAPMNWVMVSIYSLTDKALEWVQSKLEEVPAV